VGDAVAGTDDELRVAACRPHFKKALGLCSGSRIRARNARISWMFTPA